MARSANFIADMPIARKDIPVAKLASEAERESEERIFHARLPIVVSPFILERTGRIRVRAHYSDGAILKLGSIDIKVMTLEELKAFQENNAQVILIPKKD